MAEAVSTLGEAVTGFTLAEKLSFFCSQMASGSEKRTARVETRKQQGGKDQ
jgi:hypothetical protein